MNAASDLAEDRAYTPAETAERLGGIVSEYWLNQQARKGRIPCTKLGRKRVFSRANIIRIIAICNVEPTAGAPERPARKASKSVTA